ncbi:MAG: restriction endonuclease subunit S, partial [Kiritimatiellae bacterium]|nr:restriction endonuclease subunit S [Kiritimatiellia bacterium]
MKKGWRKVPLADVLYLDIDAVPVNSDESYPFAGVYGFGRGLFKRDSLKGSDTTYSHFHRLHEGQLVMSQPKGWEGAITVVP